jgi:NADPH:quinone reductase-like Zn-dependent oxidoreductase
MMDLRGHNASQVEAVKVFSAEHKADLRAIELDVTSQRSIRIGHQSDAARLGHISGLCDAGAFRVVVDSTLPLDEAKAGLTRSASGRSRGKILLRPN